MKTSSKIRSASIRIHLVVIFALSLSSVMLSPTDLKAQNYHFQWGDSPAEFEQLKSKIQKQSTIGQFDFKVPEMKALPMEFTPPFEPALSAMRPLKNLNAAHFQANFRGAPLLQVISQLAEHSLPSATRVRLDRKSLDQIDLTQAIDFSSNRTTAKDSLNDLLKTFQLLLHPVDDGFIITRASDTTTIDQRLKSSSADFVSLQNLALQETLNQPHPIIMNRVPLDMFLSFVEGRLQKRLAREGLPRNRRAFELVDTGDDARTLGESLKSGLNSVGLDYELDDDEIKIISAR